MTAADPSERAVPLPAATSVIPVRAGREGAAVDVDALYTMSEDGLYHYTRGYNPVAIGSTAVAAALAMALVLLGSADAAAFSWFVGAGVAFVAHWALSRRQSAPAAA